MATGAAMGVDDELVATSGDGAPGGEEGAGLEEFAPAHHRSDAR